MYNLIMVKTHVDNVLKMSTKTVLIHRTPWLLIGLFGGLFSAKIVEFFETTLQKNLILAAFIPLIVYMADAVGSQMESFIIRDTAINPRLNFVKYLLKQLFVVSIVGLLISTTLFFVSLIIYKDVKISITLFLSLLFAIISSVVTGLIIPYLFERTRLDPANASGPIATVIQDILSVLIYFFIASIILT